MPALSSVHIDRALTNFSVAYINEGYVAEMVMPPLPVEKRSDKYFVYDRDTFLRGTALDANGLPRSLRRPRTEAAEVEYNLSTDTFYCEEYAHKALVTDEEVTEADNPLQPDLDATTVVTERLKLDNEIMTAKLACNSAGYAAANKVLLTTGGSGTSWASYASANSLPLSDIKNGKVQVKKGVLREANRMLVTMDTGLTLADHPDIKELVKYVSQDALTTSGLPKVVRGLMVIEGGAQKATSAEGVATVTSGNVWVDENSTNIALIFHHGGDVGPRSIHFGRAFEAKNAGMGNARGFAIRRYRDNPKKGEWIEGCMTRDWKFIAKDVNGANGKPIGGYLISGATL